MSIDAMSAGLTSVPRFGATVLATLFCEPPVMIVLLSTGVPSITISGWLLPLMVLVPRIWMNDEEPGSPPVETTWTLGALPAKASMKFDSSLRWIRLESIWLRTLPSFSVCVTVPAPVTTTSPSCSGFAARVKSCVWAPGVSMICVLCDL